MPSSVGALRAPLPNSVGRQGVWAWVKVRYLAYWAKANTTGSWGRLTVGWAGTEAQSQHYTPTMLGFLSSSQPTRLTTGFVVIYCLCME